MSNKLIAVMGSTGLLGTTLQLYLKESGINYVAHSCSNDRALYRGDLVSTIECFSLLNTINPDIIINLVALADVDECERNPQRCYLVNVKVVENIVEWIRRVSSDVYLIHISTDQLYDGEGPHSESDVCLKNYYAFSKYASELVAVKVRSTVLRINFFGRSRTPRRASFSDWLVKSLQAREPITVFEDVLFTPLSLETLSRLILRVVERRIPGVFNLGSREGMSKADFAFALADVLGLETTSMRRGSVSSLGARAYRPRDMRMDSSRFEKAFDVRLPTLREEIESMRSEYETGTHS